MLIMKLTTIFKHSGLSEKVQVYYKVKDRFGDIYFEQFINVKGDVKIMSILKYNISHETYR